MRGASKYVVRYRQSVGLLRKTPEWEELYPPDLSSRAAFDRHIAAPEARIYLSGESHEMDAHAHAHAQRDRGTNTYSHTCTRQTLTHTGIRTYSHTPPQTHIHSRHLQLSTQQPHTQRLHTHAHAHMYTDPPTDADTIRTHTGTQRFVHGGRRNRWPIPGESQERFLFGPCDVREGNT